jgi:leucyl aminopeptidase
MKIEFPETLPKSGALAVAVTKDKTLSPTAKLIDQQTHGAIARALKVGRFTGEKDQVLELVAPAGLNLSRIVLYGLGDPKAIDALALENAGGNVVQRVNGTGDSDVVIAVDALAGCTLKSPTMAAEIAFGARLGAYRFDRYLTTEKPEKKPSVKRLGVYAKNAAAAARAFERLAEVAEGVELTRNLVSEPANVLYPASFAARCEELKEIGVKVEVLDLAQIKKLGMRALIGVAQGSANEPRVVIMRWNGGAKADDKPIAFIGKGVTFDTGGISIKPAAGMEEMKWDMGGAGVVTGLMRALAGRKARVNVVAALGLVENMPSSTAQRPGDVVKAMSGKTIEIINTDAEGRLVLADVLWHIQQRFKPKMMIDLATLTGAIIVALGHNHAGLFANNDRLADWLLAAGLATGERLWRMPLHDSYEQDIKSPIADIKNVGDRWAGSISAALFLKHFVNDVPWAHLDIAGTTWCYKNQPTVPKGGSGFGVRLLDRLVADHYERGGAKK